MLTPTYSPSSLLIRLAASASLSLGLATASWAQGVPSDVQAAIEEHTQGSVPIDSISTTPIAGIYQVTSGNEIFYSDSTGRYAFVGGALMDMKDRRDVTAPALEKLNTIPWESLPLSQAIVQVHGNGQRKMAVFEDPLCPICRVFTKFVDQLENVTVYRFVFPVIDPQSAPIARKAWCSPDRNAAWNMVMNGRNIDGREDCDISGLVEILKFGEANNIANTPTVILGNGKRLVGATPPEQFIAELDASVIITH